MAGSHRARKVGALFCLLGAPACSFFVSLEGLSDGGATADAGGVDSAVDAGPGPSNDAAAETSVDAHVPVAPLFRSLTTASNSGEMVTVTRPPQIQAGDLMIALVYEYQDTSTTTPPDATWQAVDSFHDPTPSYEVHYFQRFATASEPSSFTFATTGLQSGYASVTLVAYSGVNPSPKPIELHSVTTAEGVLSFSTPAVSTTLPNTVLMISAVGDGQSAAVWTAPANITPRLSNGYIFVGDATQAATGPHGVDTITVVPSTPPSVSGGIAIIGLTPQ